MGTGPEPPGEHPPPDGERAAPGGRTWTSGLSTAEFGCLRAAGFTPVGQVMGASVRASRPWTMTESPDRASSWIAGSRAMRGIPANTALYTARDEAMRAMAAECRALGGDGIVAVHVEIGPFQGQEHTLAFQATGTAVRAEGNVHPREPFS